MSGTRAPRRADDGITLAELIISITILSFIMGAISFALVIALRNSQANESRLSGAAGAQLLSAWFTSDVQSARTTTAPVIVDPALTACADVNDGENKLLFERSADSATISYRVVQAPGAEDFQLRRVTCAGAASTSNVVAFGLRDAASVTVAVDVVPPSGELNAVTIDAIVGTRDPVTVHVVGTPRARSTALSPTTCAFVSAVPQSIVIAGDLRPAGDVTFELATTGDCGTLAMSIPTGGTPGTLSPTVSGSGNIRTATVPVGPTTWGLTGATPRLVTVTTDGLPLAAFPLHVVPAPCGFVSATPDKASTDFERKLTGNVPMTVKTTGYCQALTVRIATGGGTPDPLVAPALAGGPFTWTTTIPRPVANGGALWNDGAHIGTVLEGLDVVGTFTFTTQQICSMTSNSSTPIALTSAGRIALATAFSVTTVGDCTDVDLLINTNGGPIPLTVTLSGGPVWTGSTSNGQWSPGAHTIAVRGTSAFAGVATLGQFTVTAVEPTCVLRSADNRIGVNSAINKVLSGETLTVRTNGTCGATVTLRFTPPGGTLQTVAAPLDNPSGRYETGDLGGTNWTHDTAAVVSVYDSTTVFDTTTLAGTFVVTAQ